MTVGCAVLIGAAVRLSYVTAFDFPLNDGGLFFAMTRDLQAAHYRLPETTSYNSAGIPFAYPPLAFYLAAALNDVAGISLESIFRFVPLAANIAMIPAFFLLSRRLVPSRFATAAATMLLALLPRAFYWMIMGGGITRSLGFLFAVLALWAMTAAYQDRRPRFVAAAALFGALALLSHIQMAWFVAFSSGLLWFAYGRHRFGALASVSAAMGAAVLSAPWWMAVLAQHGPDPFFAAARGGDVTTNPLVVLLQFTITNELLFPAIAALGLGGVLLALGERRYILPGWLLACLILDQRAFGTVAAIPLALLGGLAVEHIWRYLHHDSGPRSQPHAPPPAVWLLPAAAAVAFSYLFLSAMVSGGRLLTAMTPGERDAMAWVAANTPASSRVLVVTEDRWYADRTSEWFPYLAERQSVATVQGYEWLEGGVFAQRLGRYRDVQDCARDTTTCLDAWSAESGIGFDYVYVPKLSPRYASSSTQDVCCAALLRSLAADARYRSVYDEDGATVFQRRGGSGITQPGWSTPQR
ncbi:MAG: glycosyltransferase family 39 protein [Chloroflexi bacterium]|nr:glycosyltransferase family 39 protein [Chloroflexota bacterium]